jgi:hypothetical protein
MAIAPSIKFGFADNDADKATHEVHIDSGLTLAQYSAFALLYAPVVENMIVGTLNPVATLSIPVDISALVGNVATSTGDVEQIAAFAFRCDEGGGTELNIPGLRDENLVPFSDALDTADAPIAAVVAMMEDGLAVTGGTISPSDIAEDDIIATLWSRGETRNSGRRR